VRSVPAAAIDRWLPHAVTTWGTADDLRALLPRVCELLAAIAELGRELSPYLDDWLLLVAAQGVGEPARLHLVDLARRVQHLRDAGIGVDGLFWSPRPDEAHRLELWITSPVVTPHLAQH
jgi:hypothetical protein